MLTKLTTAFNRNIIPHIPTTLNQTIRLHTALNPPGRLNRLPCLNLIGRFDIYPKRRRRADNLKLSRFIRLTTGRVFNSDLYAAP